MATKTRRRPPAKRPIQHPKPKPPDSKRPYAWIAAGIVIVIVLALAGALLLARDDDSPSSTPDPEGEVSDAAAGLPETSDYHSLLVAPGDAKRVFLGTHGGLYQSTDGGRTWHFAELEGQDAMNLARADADVVWAAGHDVLAKSTNGGKTWEDIRPRGLPGLDLHGFATDPSDPNRLYAAVAGVGLFRSVDGGSNFAQVQTDVGAAVMALALTPRGRLLAGDMQRGLLVSDDDGRRWRVTLPVGVMGVAVNPSDGKRVLLAATDGLALSRDGGMTWKPVLALSPGAGPVAWAPSEPSIAYAVGFDGILYTTTDGGLTWQPVV